jgi:tripartite ATP-independent transporter DctM subunit
LKELSKGQMLTPLLISFFALTLFSMPVAFAIGIAVTVAILFFSPIPPIGVVQRFITGVDSFVLLAIPLFILTGRLMNTGGITDHIFTLARNLVGHIRGGLAHANVLASMLFSGMSGSAVADAGGLGTIEIKAMREQGYKAELAAGLTAASSAIGPIIPPSIPFVIYGAIAEVSVGRLFLAGIIPGLLMGLSLMGMIVYLGRRDNYPKFPRASLREIWQSIRTSVLSLLTPVIIVGGILFGVFTPTEAAAVAAVYAFILGFVIYRTIKLRDIPNIMIDTLVTSAIVTFIIATTSGFSWILALNQVGAQLVAGITSITENPLLILFIINIVLLLLGALMEAGVVLILLTPILVPLIISVGIDPIHFGVIMVLNLMIGVATPPIGMSLFVVSEVSGVRVEKLMRSVLPFLLPLFITLLIVTYFPGLVMFLPGLAP